MGKIESTINGLEPLPKNEKENLKEGLKHDRVITNLQELKLKEPHSVKRYESFLMQFKNKGLFTPNQVRNIFWRLTENSIEFKESDYKIDLDKKSKEQIKKMKSWELKKIEGCLTKDQNEHIKRMMRKL